MTKCKSKIPDSNEECGLEIKWKYPYMQVPAGEKNRPLNLDGSPHWGTCRANPDSHPPMDVSRPKDEPKIVVEKERVFTAPHARETLQQEPEFEAADAKYNFDRTHKLVELTINKSRKCHNKTIPQLPDFESLTYFINAKIECELGSDFHRIVKEKFAEITMAIDREIDQDKLRLSGLENKSQ